MMDARQIFDRLAGYLQQVLGHGMSQECFQLEIDQVDAELVEGCECLNQFLRQLHQAFELSAAMADGDLAIDLPRNNSLLMPTKTLQANLNHMSWQICRIAAGDLNQQVRFLGEFSVCFNSMIDALKQKREIEQRLKIITSVLGAGVCLVNQDGILTYINPEAEKLLGHRGEDLFGGSLVSFFQATVSDSDNDGVLHKLAVAIEKGTDFHTQQLVVAGQENEMLSVALECRPVWQNDVYTGAVIAFHDISAQKRYEERLEQMNQLLEKQATTDSLTGIWNRLKLGEVLAQEIYRARRYQTALSVVILDIDHFKLVNDRFGHPAGDEVLKAFAALLQNGLRAGDYVGRWGGEEFLIVLPQLNCDNACLVADKLRRAIAQYDFPVCRQVTSSFGVAEVVTADTPASLTARADRALYRAKDSGRNRVEVEG
ncbi:MAG: diguanylate cyclase [Thermodesulfobacteriota bacterium]|nr:diguanylate cyclase [Thermodesulfobacteriota bacterium]